MVPGVVENEGGKVIITIIIIIGMVMMVIMRMLTAAEVEMVLYPPVEEERARLVGERENRVRMLTRGCRRIQYTGTTDPLPVRND